MIFFIPRYVEVIQSTDDTSICVTDDNSSKLSNFPSVTLISIRADNIVTSSFTEMKELRKNSAARKIVGLIWLLSHHLFLITPAVAQTKHISRNNLNSE